MQQCKDSPIGWNEKTCFTEPLNHTPPASWICFLCATTWLGMMMNHDESIVCFHVFIFGHKSRNHTVRRSEVLWDSGNWSKAALTTEHRIYLYIYIFIHFAYCLDTTISIVQPDTALSKESLEQCIAIVGFLHDYHSVSLAPERPWFVEQHHWIWLVFKYDFSIPWYSSMYHFRLFDFVKFGN